MSLRAFDHLERIRTEIRRHERVHFFLDFDGTLTPIVPRPEEAVMRPNVRDLVTRIAGLADLSIVSGRSLRDLQSRVGLDVIYAGNHGLEIEGKGLSFREPKAVLRSGELRDLIEILRDRLRDIRGVVIEDKDLTASVHFRNAEAGETPLIARTVETVVRDSPFHVRRGREVLEIRPGVDWHKGTAAAYILEHTAPAYPIALGDDGTDEDLFRAMLHGLTVHVGPGPTTAAYMVEDPSEAACLLESLSSALEVSGQGQTRR